MVGSEYPPSAWRFGGVYRIGVTSHRSVLQSQTQMVDRGGVGVKRGEGANTTLTPSIHGSLYSKSNVDYGPCLL